MAVVFLVPGRSHVRAWRTLRDRITEIGCLPEIINTTTLSKNLKIKKIAE